MVEGNFVNSDSAEYLSRNDEHAVTLMESRIGDILAEYNTAGPRWTLSSPSIRSTSPGANIVKVLERYYDCLDNESDVRAKKRLILELVATV